MLRLAQFVVHLVFLTDVLVSGQSGYQCKKTLKELLPNGRFASVHAFGKKQRLIGCDQGFELNTLPLEVFHCQRNHRSEIEWTSATSSVNLQDVRCERRRRCPPPPEVPNAVLVPGTGNYALDGYHAFFSNDSLEFRCKPGFEHERKLELASNYTEMYDDYPQLLPSEKVVSVTTCTEDGVWRDADNLSPCVETHCPLADLPPVQHGHVEAGNQSVLTYGERVKLVCDPGAVPVSGWVSYSCSSKSSFQMTEEEFGCRRIECPEVPFPLNGYILRQGCFWNETVEFRCDEGYTLRGSSTWVCLENGQWNESCVTCDKNVSESHCPSPCIPIGAAVRSTGNMFKPGDEVLMDCPSGMVYGGDKNRACLPDLSWTGSPIQCTEIERYDVAAVGSSLADGMRRLYRERPRSERVQSEGRSIERLRLGGNNLIIAVDASESISKVQFDYTREFIKTFVRNAGISNRRDGTRLAIYAFAGSFTKIIDEIDSKNAGDLSESGIEATEKIEEKLQHKEVQDKLKDKSTDLRNAFKSLNSEVDNFINQKVRPNSKYVVFVLTDGEYTYGGDPFDEAKALLEKPVTMELYILQTGSKGERTDMLKGLASPPVETHFFLIKNDEDSWMRLIEILVTGDEFVCGNTTGETKLTNPQPREEDAAVGAWPWYAALTNGTIVSCGGTLVAEEWVLTAAHCFEEKVTSVLFKKHKLSSQDGILRRGVKRRYPHPNYRPGSKRYHYDLALIRLTEAVSYSPDLRPLCLLEEEELEILDNKINSGRLGVVVGFGKLQNGNSPDTLQQKLMTIQPDDRCPPEPDGFDKDIMFCAGNTITVGNEQRTVDACLGDSGGAFVSRNITGNKDRFVQLGVVSWGQDGTCRQPNKYGVYTKLTPRLTRWATSTMATVDYCGKTDSNKTRLQESPNEGYANAGAWPWYVFIRGEKRSNIDKACGGTILNERWVLTAAHCLVEDNKKVILKSINRGHREDAIDISPEDMISHPNYNSQTLDYDIGLVKLGRRLLFNAQVKPICLPDTSQGEIDTAAGTWGVVVGYGKPKKNASLSQRLRQMEFRIKPNDLCPPAHFESTRMFCAGDSDGQDGTFDACQGDSGGAFVARRPAHGDQERFVQLGVVSSGVGCRQRDRYGKYTKLSQELLLWIHHTMESN